ncbi:MAG: O-antigen ligase family protein [Myxococcales bacterium]|nr:O-antigen ligase family protein [Myxococcales bacterium]
MEPKQLVFLMGLAGVTGAFFLLFRDPKRRMMWSMGSVLFFLGFFYKDITLFFEPYRGSSSGLSIAMLDAPVLALAIFLWPKIRLDGVGRLFLLFLGWCLLGGLFAAARKDYFFFEMGKHLRVLFFYLLLVAQFSTLEREELEEAVTHIVLIFCWIQLVLSLHQRFTGMYRLRGSFAHSNTLSIMMNMMAPFLLSKLFLSPKPKQRLLFAITLGGACAAVIMTRSRAGWIILGLGLASSYGLMIARGLVSRLRPASALRPHDPFPSLRLTMGLAVLGTLMLLKFLPAMLERIAKAPKSSAAARHHHNDQCKELAKDHLFGVGLNQYVHAQIHVFGQDPEAADTTVAHHLYWLIAGETGYIGLLLFALIPLYVVFWLLRGLLISHALSANALFLGICTAFLQSFAEPVLRQQRSMLLVFFFMALAMSLSRVALAAQTNPKRVKTPKETTIAKDTSPQKSKQTPPKPFPIPKKPELPKMPMLPGWAATQAYQNAPPNPSTQPPLSWRNRTLTTPHASKQTVDRRGPA